MASKLLSELCSKCHKGFMNCECEHFHPNLESNFTLSDLEVKELLRYFHDSKGAGYISHEFFPLLHEIIDRMISYDRG